MRCRLYLPGTADARVLDGILDDNRQGDVRLDQDRIVCATGDDNVPAGCLVWRPSAFVHEFHVPPVLGQGKIAADLFNGAVRLDVGRRHRVTQAVFMVDSSNHRMLRFVRDDLHAIEQQGTIFLLNLKAPGGKLTDESY